MKPEYEYIRRHYGRTFERGQAVSHTITKRFGTVRQEDRSQGHYVRVKFDGDKFAVPCHPEELANAR